MFTQKNKYLWLINLILFIGVVFVGIEQGGIGAEIRKVDETLKNQDASKREISEKIYEDQEVDKSKKIEELGFMKPTNILYFDTEEAIAKLPVQ